MPRPTFLFERLLIGRPVPAEILLTLSIGGLAAYALVPKIR